MWKPFMTPLFAALVVLGACDAGEAPAPADEAQEVPQDSPVAEAAEPGVLTPINRSGVRGRAELEEDGDEIEVLVEAEGLESGARYTVQVHEGRCADEGPVRLTLDDIVAGGDGTGSTRGDTSGGQVAADTGLFVQILDGDGEAVACAELERERAGS